MGKSWLERLTIPWLLTSGLARLLTHAAYILCDTLGHLACLLCGTGDLHNPNGTRFAVLVRDVTSRRLTSVPNRVPKVELEALTIIKLILNNDLTRYVTRALIGTLCVLSATFWETFNLLQLIPEFTIINQDVLNQLSHTLNLLTFSERVKSTWVNQLTIGLVNFTPHVLSIGSIATFVTNTRRVYLGSQASLDLQTVPTKLISRRYKACGTTNYTTSMCYNAIASRHARFC